MMTEPSVSEQTYQHFTQEAADLLRTIEYELQGLRLDFSLQKVHALMRAAHTLKGASASVGLETLKTATHSLEGVFQALCYPDTVISARMEQLIFEGYDCLQILVSSQLEGSQVEGADVLDRMAVAISELQEILGDRFGREGYLPTSSELGFDMTQSIFELGVNQRINSLSAALEDPDPVEISDLLRTQVVVFTGLGQSLELPGFEAIAKLVGQALAQRPDRVLEIAAVALDNFQVAQMAVLGGDRTQGGSPTAELQQCCDPTHLLVIDSPTVDSQSAASSSIAASPPAAPVAGRRSTPHRSDQRSWLKRRWQMLMNPLGNRVEKLNLSTPEATAPKPEVNRLEAALEAGLRAGLEETNPLEEVDSDSDLLALSMLTNPIDLTVALETPDTTDFATSGLADITPAELNDLNVEPNPSEPSSNFLSVSEAEVGKRSNTEPKAILDEQTAETVSRSGRSVRISVDHLEKISQTMGELLTQQNRQMLCQEQLTALIKKLLNRISTQQQQLNRQQNQRAIDREYSTESSLNVTSASSSASAYSQFDLIELDRYSDLQLLLQSCLEETVQQSESAEAIELFLRQSGQSLEKQKRLLSNTRETLLEARMLSLGTIFERLLPVVERLQSQGSKQVDVVTSGKEILVDKAIADNLYEPLLHLVRNAFDHGIELPESRLSARKPFAGKISIEGSQQGRHLLISVRDDGKGLDLERIRHKAVENRLITLAEADTLTPEQTVDLLFEAGFSTLSEADSVSGRGVGLDVVQAKMRSLQGWVSVDHKPGAGSCFTLQIPATLTIAKLLLCRAQGRTYALIADAVEHILIPTAKQVRTWKGGKMLTWQFDQEEYLVPVNALDEVLHYASSRSDRRQVDERKLEKLATNPVILMQHQDTLVGLEVEQLLGEQELTISPLGQTIIPPAYLYGSSILPDGELTLVLDGVMLAKIIVEQRQHNLAVGAARKVPLSEESVNNKPRFLKPLILTIDDSITVRNTLAEALQRANYQVIQACDGAEALQKLDRYPDVQVILCDIEMPGMNGFEFLKVRQQKPAIAAIPTIMLTSRTGDKHRKLTDALGATTYITKPYLTPKLLKAVSLAIQDAVHPLLSTKGDSDG